MSDEPRYMQVYAVVRTNDGPLDDTGRVRESTIDGVEGPAPGPSQVSVKEVVITIEEARREVVRLNAFIAGKGCTYYWQTTHLSWTADRTVRWDVNNAKDTIQNNAMSDEPKKRLRRWIWIVWTISLLVISASYEAMRYATASWISVMRTDHVCVIYDQHTIGGKPAPEWMDRYFFWPSERIHELTHPNARPWNQWPHH
jgi:hypothetical protein